MIKLIGLTSVGIICLGMNLFWSAYSSTLRQETHLEFDRNLILQRNSKPGAWAIPKITRTPEGNALIVVQDRAGGDWGKPIYPVALRSDDGGKRWTDPVRLIPDDFPRIDRCLFKPTGLVADLLKSKLFVFISRAPLTKPDGSPLLERDFYQNIQATRRQGRAWFVVESSDDGRSWSTPKEITHQLIKKHHWQEWSPVHSGLQIQTGPFKGRLVVPVRCHCPPSDPSPTFDSQWQTNGVLFSDDHGATWTPGGTTGAHFGEASLVELGDGSLYLHQRASFSQKPQRWYAFSTDGGVTFSESKLTGQRDAPCHAGITKLADNRLLLSHVPGPGRKNLTLSISDPSGRDWREVFVIDSNPTAYSDLCRLADDSFLLVYETGKTQSRKDIAVARFNASWLQTHLINGFKNP